MRRGKEGRVRSGHAWVFANEIDGDVAALEPGGAVEVRTQNGDLLGRGYANPRSLITVRILSRDPDADIDSADFYVRSMRRALALRQRVLPGRSALRLVASEADELGGLVIDRYGDVLAVQVGTLGLERRLELLREAIERVFQPRGVMLRNDSQTRTLEGLETGSRLWFGEVPDPVRFSLHGLELVADVRGGQKTGFFFDQADNREFAFARCQGLDVADLYSNTGTWAVGALAAGARSAVAVDINAQACGWVRENARLNGVEDRIQVQKSDVKAAMAGMGQEGRRFGAVFLDPPAFAKSRKTASKALRAYRSINQAAMALVEPGGLLYTSSCSYHIREDRFLDELVQAGRRAGRSLRVVRRGGQAPDHPVHPAIPETRYLKHFVLVVD